MVVCLTSALIWPHRAHLKINYNNMPPKKPVKPNKIVPFQKIVDAKVDYLSGMSFKKISEKHNLPINILKDRLERIDNVLESNLPALSTERKLISEALSEKLKPIKEELSLKSLEIVRKADEIILNRLLSSPDDVDTKDILKASDQHSSRLARITGLEEDPSAGSDPNLRSKVVNTYIQNIFNSHAKNLEEERLKVNDTTPAPIEVNTEDRG